MIRDFHLADFFTLANGACGTAAIFFAMDHVRLAAVSKIYAAGVFEVMALFFDVMDGRVARWRQKASSMGRELDSLADVVSFGVAPACLAYSVGMTGLVDAAVLLYFVVCGISRLARYNITAESLSSPTGKVEYFEGTPITTTTSLVLILVALAAMGRTHEALPLGIVHLGAIDVHPFVALFGLSGSLMISKTLHIPKP
jgi:CDP-diacylglycerol--serine O-phosphatidyltransferase